MSILENISADHFGRWLYREIMQKRMISPLGIAALLLVSLATGFLAANDLFFVPLAAAAALIGIVLVYVCLFKPLAGFYVTSLFAVFVFYPNHLIGRDLLPLSPVWEILMLFTFLGSFLHGSKQIGNSGRLLNTMVSIVLMGYTFYLIAQVFNPNVPNLDAWFPSVRRWLVFMLMYVTAYRLIDSPEKVRFFVRFWVLTALMIAAYGCYQQWFGLLPMEMNWIMSTPGSYELLFQGGQIRKFSFLSDPATFGMQSGAMAVFTAVIAINTKDKKRKFLWLFFSIIMLLGMAYSGTRTSTIIPPIGIMIYGMLTIQNKTTVITIFISSLLGLFLFFAPIYSSPTLNRMRTTFDTKDESLNLRERNRHYIQPYLYAHPIGGGMGTTNTLGAQLFPDHPLADFPTDSGLLRVGLELGWIGLILWVIFNLAIMWQGILYFFRIRNPEYRLYMVAILSAIFPIIVCQYSQESIGQFPGIIFIFSCLSIMKRMLEMDEEEQMKLKNIKE
ncbi:MAG TPA: O-antigen ligase family protein [Ferruginibacter sp.]|nr:O-antigen ligase family protein [Ferruginibacter sp.]HRO06079.1 O-antigen ligase family protein [Ferruginibacter sp.]HRO95666.1 O-antigen ligase family protein [Ferruginibacter sp.]HRP49325.1 O-antigen ligase family protein [Ferruginibacter sp.]